MRHDCNPTPNISRFSFSHFPLLRLYSLSLFTCILYYTNVPWMCIHRTYNSTHTKYFVCVFLSWIYTINTNWNYTSCIWNTTHQVYEIKRKRAPNYPNGFVYICKYSHTLNKNEFPSAQALRVLTQKSYSCWLLLLYIQTTITMKNWWEDSFAFPLVRILEPWWYSVVMRVA